MSDVKIPKVPKGEISILDTEGVEKNYSEELSTNPKYSLEVDPENLYSLCATQKEFIKYYVQFKNIILAAQLSGISEAEAKDYFKSYATQQEIRRISTAMYHRQFASKLLSVDQIGGYLSSLLTDENVPLADRLETKDKLKVADMILEINKLKAESLTNPETLDVIPLQEEIKNLSVSSIKKLIKKTEKVQTKLEDKKDQIINEIDDFKNMPPEEKEYLKTLPTENLITILKRKQEKIKKTKGGDGNAK